MYQLEKNLKKYGLIFLKKRYAETHDVMYSKSYKSVKDMKVSDVETNKKLFDDWFSQHQMSLFYNLPIVIHNWERETGASGTGNLKEDFFKQIGMRNIVNQSYFDYMKSQGFDAIADTYGNESGGKKSIIILDPDNTLHLISQKEISLKDK